MSQWPTFDPDRPLGAQQNGTGFGASVRANGYALWQQDLMGGAADWSLTASGGTAEQPAQFLFSNAGVGSPLGDNRLKGAVTWGADGNITQIVWTGSQDGGGTYATGRTQVFTYDSSGNFTGTTGVSGMLSFIGYVLGRVKETRARLAIAEALLDSLGTMSVQDATGIAVTGGTLKGTPIGGTGVGEAQLAYLAASREKWVDLGSGTPTNTFTIDFAAAGSFRIAPGNNFTIAVTNQPTNGFAQKVVLEIVGASGFTCTLPAGYTWGGAGAPTFTTGTDLVTVYCRSDATTPVKRFMLSSYG